MDKISLQGFRSHGIHRDQIDRLELELPFLYLSDKGLRAHNGAHEKALKDLITSGFSVNKGTVKNDFNSFRSVWRYFHGTDEEKQKLNEQVEKKQPQTWLLKSVLEAGVKSWEELNVVLPTEPPATDTPPKKQKRKFHRHSKLKNGLVKPETGLIPVGESLPINGTMAKAVTGMLTACGELRKLLDLQYKYDSSTINRMQEFLKRQVSHPV